MNIGKILNNASEFNSSMNNILETLSNINIIDYQNYTVDHIDNFLVSSTEFENKILDNKHIQKIDITTNNFLSNVGTYGMILALPMGVFGIVTGGVGSLLFAPAMFLGSWAIKTYANRKISILKSASSLSKLGIMKIKERSKQFVRTKSLQSSTNKLTLKNNKNKAKNIQKISSNIQTKRQVAYLNKEMQERINKFNNMYSNIVMASGDQYLSIVESNMKLLQLKGVDTILQLKLIAEKLKVTKSKDVSYSGQINSMLIQNGLTVNAIKETFEITDEMIYDRYIEIVKNSEKEESPISVESQEKSTI